MAGPTIRAQTAGSPYTEFQIFKAGTVAVTKGDCLKAEGVTGYTAVPTGAVTDNVIGIAQEAGAIGAWFKAVVRGFCSYMTTDNSVAEGQDLIPSATAGAADSQAASAAGSTKVFGQALQDDVSTTLTAAIVWCKG